MNSGRLRTPIVIQTCSETTASNGESSRTWTAFASPFAELKPLSGREYLRNDQTRGEITHQIKLRYVSGVTDKMRIISGSRIFEIVAVLPDRTNARELVIMANERSA